MDNELSSVPQNDVRMQEAPQTVPASTKTVTLRAILKGMRDSADAALRLLEDAPPETAETTAGLIQPDRLPHAISTEAVATASLSGDRVIEGVFDGENMVGGDGKVYSVPPNYASKSKLVEGDMMKLTIGSRGNFIYKQIGPIERRRLIGTLAYDQDSSQHFVLAAGRSWRVLKASVTFFKGDVADEAVILVPKNAPSKWAAVENIIKQVPQRL